MRIQTFQGLRPASAHVEAIASPPYDVVTTAQARALTANNPLSLLRVVRAEVDHPEGTDPYSDAVYTTAKTNLEWLQKQGYLIRESAPCLYIYAQERQGHLQTGVVAVCHIYDYEQDIIKKHERTQKYKETDRTRLIHTLNAHPGPVFLAYRDCKPIDTLVNQATVDAPLYDFTASDGVRHTVWRVQEQAPAFVAAFAQVAAAYVADGHHRSASAVRVGQERRAAAPYITGREPYHWFLCGLFPASQLTILPYNRLIRDLNGLTPTVFLKKLRASCSVTKVDSATPQQPHDIRLYLDRQWFQLGRLSEKRSLVDDLDVACLQREVFAPLLGIRHPRTSKRIDFVGGIHSAEVLMQRVDSGQAAVAFSLYPITIDQLMAIADAGEILLPKSTWFEPKLRSGLFIHTF